MKWCRFQIGGKVGYGIVEDEARVIEVSGSPFETYTVTATTYPLNAVKLLVAVIGKKARHLSPENALSCVLGYTIGNDVSQRTWQIQDGSLWRAKNSDTFKPMGPWIATGLSP